MSDTRWTRALTAADVEPARPRTVKIDGKQIAVFRTGDGALHAIDNRCPHEGYPLATGALKDGVLTCEWHNWKFRLCDGVCLLGGEDVRRYPLRVDDGAVWLDLADPPGYAQIPRYLASLDDAFDELDWGHAARTVERLLAAGATPAEILAHGCAWGARRAPYGYDHGLAAAADLAALAPVFADEPTVPLLQALSLIVEPNARRPIRDVGAAAPVTDVGAAAVADGAAALSGSRTAIEAELRRRIEAEDLAGAEGLIRGALTAGAGPAEVLAWLTHAATDHFLGFGHSHIYCVKAEELLAAIGWQHAEPVLVSLVASIVYETREDRLPYMRSFRREVAPHTDRLDGWASRAPDPDARLDVDAVVAAVVDGSLADALGQVAAALDARVAPDRIAAALGLAAAHRLLRIDPALDARDDVSEGWLTVTHSLTHADAVRESLRRRPSAALLRGLFHSARFVQHLAPCDLPAPERPRLPDASPARVGDEAAEHGLELERALAGGDAAAAMAAMRAGLRDALAGPGISDDVAVVRALRRASIADRATLPIFVAHHVKTVQAALRVTDALARDPAFDGRADRDLPAVATARFLAHPLNERRMTRRARVARRFVVEGEMQTKLLGY